MNTKRKKKRTYRMELQYRKPSFLSLLYVFRKLSVMSHGRCHHCATAIAHIYTHTLYIGFPFLSTNWWDWMLNNVWHEFPYCCDAPVLTNVTVWPRFSEPFYFIFMFWYHKPILFWFLSSNSELRIFEFSYFSKFHLQLGKCCYFHALITVETEKHLIWLISMI